tara:strand:+ start:7547 stop:11089 length:3543 start_codon:yes stop_codon:yes gene_type:complete
MRIPTYSFRNTTSGLEVYGPGSPGNIFPNLVFIRGKDYRILSLSEDSTIEIYDEIGRVLFQGDSEIFFKPVIFKLGNNFPSLVYYRIKNSDSNNQFGKILVRDFNNVTGKVISYGYSRDCNVFDDKYQDHLTDQTGEFSLDLNSFIKTDSDTYFVNFDLYAIGGFDSAVLNPNAESYSDLLNLSFLAKTGCLNISVLSSVFYFISSKLIKVNYREIENKMKSYFGFSRNFDPITDDPIYGYLTNKISFDDFKKYILLTMCAELQFTINKEEEDTEKFNYLYTTIADEILDGNKKFEYGILNNIINYNVENPHQLKTYNSFKNLYLIVSERIQKITDNSTKKVCVLEDIYNLVYKFRTSVYIPKLVSPEQFLSDNFELIANSVKIPEQLNYVTITSSPGCAVAPFGRYAKVQITSDLLYNTFNQVLPIEPEVTRNLINKTIYIKYDKDSDYDYYCYTIVDYIDFDYELYSIGKQNNTEEKIYSQVIQGFTEYADCCALQSAIKSTEQENSKKLEITESDAELFNFILFDIDKNRTDTISITNKNYPYRRKEENSVYYIDEFLDKATRVTAPAFICVPNNYSDSLSEYNSITLSFDKKNRIHEPIHIRYDFDKIKITNSIYENDVLIIETESSHGFSIGDSIIIENSSKNSYINGSFEIIGLSGQNKITLDYDLPEEVTPEDINGTYAEFKSLNTTKIYTDVNNFSRNDFIFFEEATNSVPYRIIDIKQDYIGKYLVIEGNVPRNVTSFVKVDSKPERIFTETESNYKTLSYSLNKNPQRLNLSNIDTDLYKIYTPSNPGELARNINSKIISSIQVNKAVLKIDDTIIDDTQNNNDNTISDTSNTTNTDFDNLDYFSQSNKQVLYNKEEIAYHYSRTYLKKEYDLNEYTEVSPESDTFDWNNDGIVGLDELKILERFLLTAPKTVEEYNTDRGSYPMTSVLPNVVTATYACQENCCHDDFIESEDFTMEDVYIYDAFQAYMDSIGIAESDYIEFRNYYDSLVTQGIAEPLSNEIVYMPTTPTEQKFCGDYTNSGNISPEDSHIYYAHQLYVATNGGSQPNNVAEFSNYYDTLVASGIVPSLLSPIEKLPSLSADETIVTSDGSLNKNCELITGKDLAIYNEWIRQGKPTDIDIFNENRLEGVPRACFLPADDDGFNQGEYEEIGLGFSEQKISEVYSGVEHL